MRIGYHAHLLYSGQSYRNTGISQYIRKTWEAMDRQLGAHEMLAFVNSSFTEAASFPHTRIIPSRTPADSPVRRILFEQLRLPALCRRHNLDILHGTGFALPVSLPCPGVVSIMDASFLRFRDSHLSLNRRYLGAISRISVKRAARVIAISQATADDCVELLGAPRERVRVIYCGVDPSFHPRPEVDVRRFRAEKGLEDPFLLFVGTLEPRKNLWRLLQAFAQARKAGLRHRLVVVGGTGWLVEETLQRMAAEGLDQNVHFAGYARSEELPLWYAAADVFVYPSLLEGFGLPIAEAMACGTPVITSNVSSMPEVGGCAAAYVAPTDVDDIATRLLEVSQDAGRRAAMREAGILQAARFNWETTAHDTFAVYEEALLC